jgi:extracellular factor (EF) 3-hydroxypalmitic acid methyl ester biosynthesis protein
MVHPTLEMGKILNGNGTHNLIRPPSNKLERTQIALPPPTIRESHVTFTTSDGVKFQASLTRITRHIATFELDNPNFTPRCSEAFDEFEIVLHARVAYSGRAIVSNVLDAGLKTICEVTLAENSWKDLNLTVEIFGNETFRNEISGFMLEWLKFYKIKPEYKIIVADMQNFLTDLRLWLDQVDLCMRSSKSDDLVKLEQNLIAELARSILPYLDELFKKSELVAESIDKDLLPAHKSYMRRQLHSLVINAPFANRSFQKPLGYSGDYEMMNMIHRNQPEGRSLYEKLIHSLLIGQWPAISVRNRVAHLEENILTETARVARTGNIARILNIGCGPAWEVQSFLKTTAISDHADFTLIDFNEETLTHAGQKLVDAKSLFSRHTSIRTQQMSVFELLRRTQKNSKNNEKFDLIYCAGLFDYLAPETCRALINFGYDSLSPGGLMLIANMDDSKPFRNFIEATMDWHLIYRDSLEMLSLVPERCRELTRVIAEPTAVNLFLHTRKPE